MAKEPKPNFASFTKAELIRTIKALDKRQTKLLNRIAELEMQTAHAPDLTEASVLQAHGHHTPLPPFPWEQSK